MLPPGLGAPGPSALDFSQLMPPEQEQGPDPIEVLRAALDSVSDAMHALREAEDVKDCIDAMKALAKIQSRYSAPKPGQA